MSNEHGRINRLQEVEDLTEYINNGWLHSGESDGPTFLWNDMIREGPVRKMPKTAIMCP